MAKRNYFVSVQADSIVQNKGDTSFEFEIQATDEEVGELQRLFNGKRESDDDTFYRAQIPWMEYHNDTANDGYDINLLKVYRYIHQLGTPETKQHIESMNIIE